MEATSTSAISDLQHSSVHALPVLQDNIIWIWIEGDQAVVVDPAVAEPVKRWLKTRKLSLEAVLQTHHHADHIGGTLELLKDWPDAAVVAAEADLDRIPFQTISIADGDQISLLKRTVEVFSVAGHTRAHVAYYLPATSVDSADSALFCGDTLFGAGCGRLFEGTAQEMHSALQRLCSLPANTRIYCAHEYTEANLRWAAALHPEDVAINKRLADVCARRQQGALSLPSSISEEQRTNLFVRAQSSEELAELRQHKDQWRG